VPVQLGTCGTRLAAETYLMGGFDGRIAVFSSGGDRDVARCLQRDDLFCGMRINHVTCPSYVS
jgi:hypothetical protein